MRRPPIGQSTDLPTPETVRAYVEGWKPDPDVPEFSEPLEPPKRRWHGNLTVGDVFRQFDAIVAVQAEKSRERQEAIDRAIGLNRAYMEHTGRRPSPTGQTLIGEDSFDHFVRTRPDLAEETEEAPPANHSLPDWRRRRAEEHAALMTEHIIARQAARASEARRLARRIFHGAPSETPPARHPTDLLRGFLGA